MSICQPVTFDNLDFEYNLLDQEISQTTEEINVICEKILIPNETVIVYYIIVCTLIYYTYTYYAIINFIFILSHTIWSQKNLIK